MKHEEYWLKRAKILEAAQNKRNDEYIKNAAKQYDSAIKAVCNNLDKWYARFAKENGVSVAEARKMMSAKELKEFKWTVEEYIRHGRENAVSGQWLHELENASARVHISRLEAIKMQLQNHAETLIKSQSDGIGELMAEHLQDGYYRTVFDYQQMSGVGSAFEKISAEDIETVLSRPWTPDGKNFSKRIWTEYRPQLIKELNNVLTQSVMRGKNPIDYAEEVAHKFKVAQHRAENLIRTETSFFRTEGQRQSYENLHVEEYEISATLDFRTSEICQNMDGKHFKTSEMKPGVNAPPFHCRCRSATCPYFDDDFDTETTRTARNADGKSYDVPASMTYKEWFDSLEEDEQSKMRLNAKKAKNTATDKKQYEKYKEVLGAKNVPKSFDKWQNLKYNDNEGWEKLKKRYAYADKPYMQEQLAYMLPNGEKDFIPGKSFIKSTKTIAGANSNTKLRVEERLIKEYGGKAGEWEKKVGKVESEKYIFDVHWYELDGKQYRMKLKSRSDKK